MLNLYSISCLIKITGEEREGQMEEEEKKDKQAREMEEVTD